MKKSSILVIGAAFKDIFIYTQKEPAYGESVEGTNVLYAFGGKGANQAVCLAKLGEKSIFLGAVGDDENGKQIAENLAFNHVNINYMRREKKAESGMAVIMVLPDGKNKILTYSKVSKTIKKEDIDKALSEEPDAIIVLFELEDDIVLHVCTEAKRKKIPVIIDAGPARPFPVEKLEGVEIFSPNETEAQMLCGFMLKDESSEELAAKILFERTGARYIVIKLGERGSLLYDGKIFRRIEAHKVQAVDTTGAGDSFTAALTVEYIKNHDIEKAIIFGNTIAAMTVKKRGAQPSFPNIAEVSYE